MNEGGGDELEHSDKDDFMHWPLLPHSSQEASLSGEVEKISRPSTAISLEKTQKSRSVYSLVILLQSRFTFSRRKTAAHTLETQKNRGTMKASSALCAVKHSDYRLRPLPMKTP